MIVNFYRVGDWFIAMGDDGEACHQSAKDSTASTRLFDPKTDKHELLVSADMSAVSNEEDAPGEFVEKMLIDIRLSIQRIGSGDIVVNGRNKLARLNSRLLQHDLCNYMLEGDTLMADSPFGDFERADMRVWKNVIIAAVLRANAPVQEVEMFSFHRPTGAYFT